MQRARVRSWVDESVTYLCVISAHRRKVLMNFCLSFYILLSLFGSPAVLRVLRSDLLPGTHGWDPGLRLQRLDQRPAELLHQQQRQSVPRRHRPAEPHRFRPGIRKFCFRVQTSSVVLRGSSTKSYCLGTEVRNNSLWDVQLEENNQHVI